MAERVVRNVENDYLMCAICLGRYRDPRLLPCGHSFCLQCLEDHIKQTVTDPAASHFKCPNDRTQIARPSVGLAPKRWASAFPADTFLGSLLSAVMIHASSGEGAESSRNAACAQHKNRIKEFFCLKCGVTACAYCIVKSHKGSQCDCISIDEAVDKVRPKCDHLRNALQKQVQFARQLQRGDDRENTNKEKALVDLGDLETKLTFYYRTALRQIAEIRNTIKEAGKTMVKENAQVSALVCNINDTISKFDETCNDGSGMDILNILPKIESQVIEYKSALDSLSKQAPAMEIHFAVNRQTERVFENPPALGSVIVQSPGHNPGERTRRYSQPVTPRYDTPDYSRFSRPMSQTSEYSDWSSLNTPRTDRTPARHKVVVNVKTADQLHGSWQLTGVALLGHNMIISDANNGQIFKFDTRQTGALPEKIAIVCPVSISPCHDSTDVLVTQPEHGKLTLIATEEELAIKEVYETSKPYEGITLIPDGKYVASCCLQGQGSLDIIDGQARVLKTLDKDEQGNGLFSWPRFLSVTTGGNILVSDRDKRTLVCLDVSGRLKWTYPTQAPPWGVSCHDDGHVYLCLDSNEIHVLTEDGNPVDNKFISRRDGINRPYAMHAVGDHVVVTEWGSNIFSPSSPRVFMFAI